LDIFNNDDFKISYEKWPKWGEHNFEPTKLLELSGLSEREVEEFKWVCLHATSNDPLFHWYYLLQILKNDLKIKLKGSALFVQDYYEFAKMLKDFLSEIKN
jgi:hypothetical protein